MRSPSHPCSIHLFHFQWTWLSQLECSDLQYISYNTGRTPGLCWRISSLTHYVWWEVPEWNNVIAFCQFRSGHVYFFVGLNCILPNVLEYFMMLRKQLLHWSVDSALLQVLQVYLYCSITSIPLLQSFSYNWVINADLAWCRTTIPSCCSGVHGENLTFTKLHFPLWPLDGSAQLFLKI